MRIRDWGPGAWVIDCSQQTQLPKRWGWITYCIGRLEGNPDAIGILPRNGKVILRRMYGFSIASIWIVSMLTLC